MQFIVFTFLLLTLFYFFGSRSLSVFRGIANIAKGCLIVVVGIVLFVAAIVAIIGFSTGMFSF